MLQQLKRQRSNHYWHKAFLNNDPSWTLLNSDRPTCLALTFTSTWLKLLICSRFWLIKRSAWHAFVLRSMQHYNVACENVWAVLFCLSVVVFPQLLMYHKMCDNRARRSLGVLLKALWLSDYAGLDHGSSALRGTVHSGCGSHGEEMLPTRGKNYTGWIMGKLLFLNLMSSFFNVSFKSLNG